MAQYIFQPTTGKEIFNGVKSAIVIADDEATARAILRAQFSGDQPWTQAAAAIPATGYTDFAGWKYRVKIGGHANQPDLVNVLVTGVATDTVDTIGVKLADALKGAVVQAAIAEDGGVYTDETAGANNVAANDMNLLPAVPAEDDAYLFGFSAKTNRIILDVGTVGTGTYTMTWEYWNGAAWAPLAGVVDGTTNFKDAGLGKVSWTIPTDWAASTINSQGPFYYVRAHVDGGTVTQVPLGSRAYKGGFTLASYDTGTNVLTIAAIEDGLGDHSIAVEITPPGAQEACGVLVGAVVQRGIAAAVLSAVLTAPTIIPKVYAQI